MTYGPMPGGGGARTAPLTLHYVNNAPFAVAPTVVRTLDVGWRTLYVEERYTVVRCSLQDLRPARPLGHGSSWSLCRAVRRRCAWHALGQDGCKKPMLHQQFPFQGQRVQVFAFRFHSG